MHFRKFLLASVVVVGTASLCRANQIQIQLDDIVGQSQTAGGTNDAFGGATNTGKVVISGSDPSESSLAAVRFNGVGQSFTDPGFTLSGTINMTSGSFTSGSVLLDMVSGADLSFNVTGGSVTNLGGGEYSLSGALSGFDFTTSTFASVNVSTYYNVQPLTGTFQFDFDPDTSGPTTGEDDDIPFFTITATTPVPEPSSLIALGGAGMVLLGWRRAR